MAWWINLPLVMHLQVTPVVWLWSFLTVPYRVDVICRKLVGPVKKKDRSQMINYIKRRRRSRYQLCQKDLKFVHFYWYLAIAIAYVLIKCTNLPGSRILFHLILLFNLNYTLLKLNTPQALEAASRAGEINDQMAAQNANSDDVSLAAQEGLEIRGKNFISWNSALFNTYIKKTF